MPTSRCQKAMRCPRLAARLAVRLAARLPLWLLATAPTDPSPPVIASALSGAPPGTAVPVLCCSLLVIRDAPRGGPPRDDGAPLERCRSRGGSGSRGSARTSSGGRCFAGGSGPSAASGNSKVNVMVGRRVFGGEAAPASAPRLATYWRGCRVPAARATRCPFCRGVRIRICLACTRRRHTTGAARRLRGATAVLSSGAATPTARWPAAADGPGRRRQQVALPWRLDARPIATRRRMRRRG